MSTGKSPTPLKKEKPAHTYEFVLTFDEQARLLRVDYPSDMSVARAAEHIKVASDWVQTQVVEEKVTV